MEIVEKSTRVSFISWFKNNDRCHLFKNYHIIYFWRRRKRRRKIIIIILEIILVFYSRHLVSSLGLFSNPRSSRDISSVCPPLSFSLSLSLCRDDDFEENFSSIEKKIPPRALRGRHEIASRKLNFGYIRNKSGKKGGRRVFHARIDMENTITRGGMHIYPLDGNSPASRIWWRNWRVLKGGWVGSGWYTGEGVVGPSNSAALSAGDIFIRG